MVLTSSNAGGRDRTENTFTTCTFIQLSTYILFSVHVAYTINRLSETISDLDIDVNDINKSETITDQLPHDINIDKTLTSQQLLSPHSLLNLLLLNTTP